MGETSNTSKKQKPSIRIDKDEREFFVRDMDGNPIPVHGHEVISVKLPGYKFILHEHLSGDLMEESWTLSDQGSGASLMVEPCKDKQHACMVGIAIAFYNKTAFIEKRAFYMKQFGELTQPK